MGLTYRSKVQDYWSTLDVIPWFPKVMSCNRFILLSSVFHLSSTEPVRRGEPNYDPWHKIRQFMDAMNAAFKTYFIPYQNLSIDESMICMKNKVAFIQYMPKKRHARFGITKFEICDSKTGYILHTALYSGKDFLAGGDRPFTEKVVVELMEKTNLFDKYYHLFTDNFYTKLPLAERLFDCMTFLTGTVNKNTKDLSKSVVQAKLGIKERIYYRRGPVLLVGYKQTKLENLFILLRVGVMRKIRISEAKVELLHTNPH